MSERNEQVPLASRLRLASILQKYLRSAILAQRNQGLDRFCYPFMLCNSADCTERQDPKRQPSRRALGQPSSCISRPGCYARKFLPF